MELPLLGVAVQVSLGDDMKTCTDARIGLGVLAPTPIRAKTAEAVLKGKPVDDEILNGAGRFARLAWRFLDGYAYGVALARRNQIERYADSMERDPAERHAPHGIAVDILKRDPVAGIVYMLDFHKNVMDF